METIDKNEFDRLTKRVEILEQKIQYLGRLLAQIGENIAADGPSEAPKSGKVCNEALPAETKAPLSAEPFRAVAPAIEHREEREINLTPAGSEPKMEETRIGMIRLRYLISLLFIPNRIAMNMASTEMESGAGQREGIVIS